MLQWLRRTWHLLSFFVPTRGIWQLKSPHPREFAIHGKKNANARGSAREGGGGLGAGGIDWCLTFIMLNVGMEDNLEFWSRQFLNSEVQNTYVFHSRVSRRHSRVITFFHINRSLCLFSFPGQNNCISLTDIHVQHLASLWRICGDKIEDHKLKVDTNRFVSEIHQIWKDLMLLDSPNVHPPLKNNKRKKANFATHWTCTDYLG